MMSAAENPNLVAPPVGVSPGVIAVEPRTGMVATLAAHRDAVALLLVLAVSLAYAALFFGKVHQVDIDVGMDYVAADMLLHGKTLYRDIAYRYGPLAPWLDCFLLREFGASVTVILAAGSVAALLIVLLTFLLARLILPPATAAVAALIVLVNATYGPHLMSYATPYSLAATYGLLFSLLALASASLALESRYSRWDFVAGAAAGLAVVTKHEFGLVALFVASLQLAFRWRQHRRAMLPAALAGLASCGAVVAVFAVPLLRQNTLAEILQVIYPKQYLDATRYFNDQVHFWGGKFWMGVRGSVADFLLNLGFVLAAGFLLVLFLDLVRGRRPKKAAFVLAAAGLPFLWRHQYLGSYPLLLPAAVLILESASRPTAARRRVIFLAIAAAAFLSRVLPAPDIARNLFALLYFAPSLIIYLYLCHSIVPRQLHRVFPETSLQAAIAAVFFLGFAAYPFARTYYPWSRRTLPVSTERGVVRIEAREAPKVEMVLGEIRRLTSPGDPILTIPHGALYYFLSNRQPASRYIYYTPGELTDGPAETKEIQQLSQTPPKLIIIDDVPLAVFFPGPRNHFGDAYDAQVSRWIQQNYREVAAIRYYDRPVHFLVPRSGAGGSS